MEMQKSYPNHVAIILDGNRRWAKMRNLPVSLGHKKGMENICELAPYIFDRGVKFLSVFGFSTENFKRTADEVNSIMNLGVEMFKKRCDELDKKNIKIIFSGLRSNLRQDVLDSMDYIVQKTMNNTKGVFNICLNYGGQQELVDATKKIVSDVNDGIINVDNIDTDLLYKYMYNELPPIDFLIRTSGEQRISNFMLYQLSYAEMYFPKVFFPDFNKDEFEKAIDCYNDRDRRFGGK